MPTDLHIPWQKINNENQRNEINLMPKLNEPEIFIIPNNSMVSFVFSFYTEIYILRDRNELRS